MTEREIREAREQWERAHSGWSSVFRALEAMREAEYELRRECERLAELIAEHDDTPIMTTDTAAAANRVVTEDDGEAT